MYELSIHQLRNFLYHIMRNCRQSTAENVGETQLVEDVLLFGSRQSASDSGSAGRISFKLLLMPSYDTALVTPTETEIPAEAIADLIPLTTYGQLKLRDTTSSGDRVYEVGLRVPKYSCVRVALHHVLAFVNSVDN